MLFIHPPLNTVSTHKPHTHKRTRGCVHVFVRACVGVYVSVHACVCACVRACACLCVCWGWNKCCRLKTSTPEKLQRLKRTSSTSASHKPPCTCHLPYQKNGAAQEGHLDFHTHTQLRSSKCVASSSMLLHVHRNHSAYQKNGAAQEGHLDFHTHTAPELCQIDTETP